MTPAQVLKAIDIVRFNLGEIQMLVEQATQPSAMVHEIPKYIERAADFGEGLAKTLRLLADAQPEETP